MPRYAPFGQALSGKTALLMASFRLLTRANVNLPSEISGKCSDGFHEICYLMVPLALTGPPSFEANDNLALGAASGLSRNLATLWPRAIAAAIRWVMHIGFGDRQGHLH